MCTFLSKTYINQDVLKNVNNENFNSEIVAF